MTLFGDNPSITLNSLISQRLHIARLSHVGEPNLGILPQVKSSQSKWSSKRSALYALACYYVQITAEKFPFLFYWHLDHSIISCHYVPGLQSLPSEYACECHLMKHARKLHMTTLQLGISLLLFTLIKKKISCEMYGFVAQLCGTLTTRSTADNTC